VSQDHTSAAVSLELEVVQSISSNKSLSLQPSGQNNICAPFGLILGQELQIGVPLVTDDFAA
jgi:hypothetical protein